MRSFLTRIAPALPAAVLLIATPAAVPARAVTHDVSIVNFDFSPAVVSVAAGDTVRWTNMGTPILHTTTDGGPFDTMPGQIWDSGLIAGDSTFVFAFDGPGRFHYFCTIHPMLMFGEVIVGGSGIKVAAIPDDIGPGAISSLAVDLSILNFTGVEQAGDLWLTVVLPSGVEIDIPAGFLSLPSNPIPGVVAAGGRLDLSTTISVPPTAPPGHYTVRVKVGTHPSIVADEDSFEFDVPAK